MGAYKEFIELHTITGRRVYLKVAYIESIIDAGDNSLINIIGDNAKTDNYYKVKETYEEIKRMLDE